MTNVYDHTTKAGASDDLTTTILDEDNRPVDLTDGQVGVTISAAGSDTDVFDTQATIDDATSGVVTFSYTAPETSGLYKVEWTIDIPEDSTSFKYPEYGYEHLYVDDPLSTSTLSSDSTDTYNAGTYNSGSYG